MSGTVQRRLDQLGIVLPPAPRAVANYRPFTKAGSFIQVSGVAPTENGCYAVVGKIGRDLDLDAGRRAARLCALNLLATVKLACQGDLDRVTRVMMLRGFVNASEDFDQIPQVINGASDLIIEVLGTQVGRHARTSIGCATLPSRVAVEIDALLLIDRGTIGDGDE